jgi:hypothetical protein
MKPRKAVFGTVISRTLRAEDLIPAFAAELRALRGALPLDIHKRVRSFAGGDSGGLVHDLIDALNEYAPAYGYFGAHEGDESDFGFWLDISWPDHFEGLRVSDTSEVPDDYNGEVMHVNDHGNISLYVAHGGRLREVWSVV